MKTISRQEAVNIISAQKDNGVFFNVVFIKRTTGELRSMTCRGGVHKYTTGEGLKFEPGKKQLIGVWEANNAEGAKEADAYRFISIEGIKTLKAAGEEYRVEGE